MDNYETKSIPDVEDIASMIGQYIRGDEPCHHLANLYNYAGAWFSLRTCFICGLRKLMPVGELDRQ